METYIHFWSYLAQFFLEWKICHTKAVENTETHFMFNNLFFRKSCRLCDKVEKYCRAGQAIDDNMAHAYCVLNT